MTHLLLHRSVLWAALFGILATLSAGANESPSPEEFGAEGRAAEVAIRGDREAGVSAPQNVDGLEERLERVENGLLPPVIIKGQPVEPMKLADRMKFYKTPGLSVAVINHGRIEWARGYGVREVNGGAITAETLFQAASISKPVAAAAALRLVQEGKLNLDEDVNRQLVSWKVPENEFAKEKIVTLRELLSHSAGLTVHGFGGYERDAPVPTLLQVLDGVKPANSDPIRVDTLPGAKFRYAGGGYVVLQQLLLDVTGKPFPALMQDTVLAQIGMAHSTYEQPLPKERWPEAAVGYRPTGEKVQGDWHTYPEMAAAGLWATPTDLASFVIELQQSLAGKSNKVLSQEMTKQMLTPQAGDWGLGVELLGKDASAGFSHGGANEGFRCILVGYNSTGRGAVLMTNSDSGSGLNEELLASIAKEYDWADYLPKEKVLAHIDPKLYDSYAGQYELDPEILLTVTAEEGRLMVQATDPIKRELYPESETRFFSLAVPAEITFEKDAKGEVFQLILEQSGARLTAKKIK